MAITDKNTLKNWFKRGAKPLASQFAAWMDSFWHKSEMIDIGKIGGLTAALNMKLDTEAFNNFKTDIIQQLEAISLSSDRAYVCGGDDEFIWPTAVRFTGIIQSSTVHSLQFKVGETVIPDIVGYELPAVTMLEIVMNLNAGQSKGVMQLRFEEIEN